MNVSTEEAQEISEALHAATMAAIEHKVNYDVVKMSKSNSYIHMPSVPPASEFGWQIYATVEAP